MHNGSKAIKNIFWLLIMAIAIIVLVVVYKKYNYNNFTKNIRQLNKTAFTRDSDVKYSEMDSYKIENKDYNDAMFSRVIDVTPNTIYKVTCKVKVENVQNEDNSKNAGAHICIADTTETSQMVTQTADWQEITLLFNSKTRTQVQIGFRLGGYDKMSKGTVWFSDIKVEAGTPDRNNTWNMVCLYFLK